MEKGNSRFYHPELDCLRFVAFMCVFLCHGDDEFFTVVKSDSAWEWFLMCTIKCGVFGVDLFFCLSSFLISTLLLREYDLRGTIDVKAFWIRRILRIWPLYYIFLLLSATVIPLWSHQEQLCGLRLLNYWFFLGNWDCAFNGFFLSPMGPLWSVSIEEQFYLTWPLLLLLVKPQRIWVLAIGMLVGANVFRLAYHPASFGSQWANTFYHFDAIAWGAIGAHLLHENRLKLSVLTRAALLLIGFLTPPYYFFCHGFQPFFDAKDILPYTINPFCALLIVVSCYNLTVVPWRSFLMRIWAYLGRISYGLYVFHVLGLTWATLEMFEHGFYHREVVGMFFGAKFWMLGAALMFTILLAWASYSFLETPFLKLKKRYTYVSSLSQAPENEIQPQNEGVKKGSTQNGT